MNRVLQSMQVRPSVVVALCAIALGYILLTSHCGETRALAVQAAENRNASLGEMLPYLLLGPDELPHQMILWGLGCGAATSSLGVCELWSGPPTGRAGSLTSPRYSLDIRIGAAKSAPDAAEIAVKRMGQVAERFQDVTAEHPFASWSDRAWYGGNKYGARVLFVRGSLVVDIVGGHKGGETRAMLMVVATRLGRKIDAALAGKPEPVPVLPPSAGELRTDTRGAWEARDLGGRVWGDACVMVAVFDANGLPRSLPAKAIGSGDYMVPLWHLSAVLGPRALVKNTTDEATVTLMGKQVVLRKGDREARVNGKAVGFSRPVEFFEGQALVPLSSFLGALGHRITWERRGAMPLGRL